MSLRSFNNSKLSPLPLVGILAILVIGILYVITHEENADADGVSARGRDKLGEQDPGFLDRENREHSKGYDLQLPERLSLDGVAELLKLKMTPEIAEIILQRARKEIAQIDERGMFCGNIMYALCKHGYSTEAWALVDPNPGTVRDLEIGAIFVFDTCPIDTLLGRLETLVISSERTQALMGLIRARPDEFSKIDLSRLEMNSTQERNSVATSILAVINEPATEGRTAEALLVKARELLVAGMVSPDGFRRILEGDRTNDPFRQWALVTGLDGILDVSDAESFRITVAKNMVQADAVKALDFLSSDSETRYSYPLLREVIATIYEVDEDSANQWVADHLATLDPETGQRIIASLTQVSIKGGEFENARKWASKITSTTIRGQILDQIHSAQNPGG